MHPLPHTARRAGVRRSVPRNAVARASAGAPNVDVLVPAFRLQLHSRLSRLPLEPARRGHSQRRGGPAARAARDGRVPGLEAEALEAAACPISTG
jgi:hypothetical protein